MTDPSPLDAAPTFEASLSQLQQIVSDLEEGNCGLEQSLSRFEEGVRLLRTCYQVLEQAERKIELLVGTDSAGNPQTVAFDADATFEPGAPSPKKAPRRRSVPKPPPAAEPAETPPESDSPSGESRLF